MKSSIVLIDHKLPLKRMWFFDLVVRHHARACHIANEILCLLKNGFADAAQARWRALHEVAATAMFIAKHGKSVLSAFTTMKWLIHILECWNTKSTSTG